jgi:lipopolysaccharide export system protein LptA
MRGAARWFLLVAIFAILGWLRFAYLKQRRFVEDQAPQKPAMLPLDVSGKAEDWYWSKTDEKGRKIVELWARNFKQDKDSSRVDLEKVRLHLFHKEGNQFDRVESPTGMFQPTEGKLYSDTEVLITLAVPAEGEPSHRLVSIRTSGVTFDSKTNVASTDRPADFTFENGTGKCVGAIYDPNTKELQMRANVELNLNARGPNGQPMKVESGQLVYKELVSQILLSPWARLTRNTATLEGGDTLVTLKKNGVIQLVETQKAKGVDLDPERQLEYSADHLIVHYTEHGDVEKVTGEANARLVSTTEFSQTTTTTDHIDLDFESKDHQSTLKSALAQGHGVVESKPTAAPAGQPLPDTRVLRSDVIEVKMRPGGREIDTVTTPTPGHLEFLPNHAGARHRRLDGSRIDIAYGERNLIRSFRSVDVETRTEPSTPKDAPLQTWSKTLVADFDPKTGQMARMQQSDDFRYVEGARKAVAKKATLEQDSNRITLESAARVWDPTGSTSADVIHLDQSNGSFTAEGHVSSSRVQDKKTPNSGILSGDEPIQATAQRMRSTNRNSFVVYEGKADMWQGASRIRADRIEIDREARRLVAGGAVQTQLLDKEKKAGGAKPAAPPVFTLVKSAGLVYTESDRLANYTGGVLLTRPGLRVKSLELRSYLSEAGAENSLDKAYADGKVEIQQSVQGRTRTGTSEHAEYFLSDEKIILRGGNPVMADSVKGNTRGDELTYFTGDDRLLVNGASERPATSRLKRKQAQ